MPFSLGFEGFYLAYTARRLLGVETRGRLLGMKTSLKADKSFRASLRNLAV